jgi:hypothetical protein
LKIIALVSGVPKLLGSLRRGNAATKQAFNPQIAQIRQRINKNNSSAIGFHDLPGCQSVERNTCQTDSISPVAG